MTLANKLTIFRIVVVIPFLICLITFWYLNKQAAAALSIKSKNIELFFIAFVLFVVAMLTDLIDGYIARKTKTVTIFGKILDPIADKIMINSTLIILSVFNFIPFWITIIFVLRDITVDGVRNFYASRNIDISASIYGKLKTFFQFVALVLIFLTILFITNIEDYKLQKIWYWLLQIPLLISLIFSLISGYLYLKPFFKKEHFK
ncbi:CDP-diacylglycerol--glycerol-3-phosphate 3-phosphatidyltransferase [Mycoplasma iguanae]|uniref:CDP-diacylglycerol--glycerol-3-phosphate 3-phosphatidyltransferase n=1 Tax=Mycoplasma iguanae TaxID=292461 RepID=A0ABY5R8G4_9MOLU|nr:CDP-diacylglycerol--glycerol-3-phosphate 3-phosphatidyltransferase [Mycoplasma iguanae]UVD81571.1 CDP-diacylglycerol--glycerol-3-phosphate 3-phosphatidyltransferase [Mycoplasma iguanae]